MTLKTPDSAPAHRLSSAIQRFDQGALNWAATTDHGPLRPILVLTARAADLLVPWVAVSVRLLSQPTSDAPPTVVRAWVGMLLAALMENGVLKPAIGRRRPDADRLPRRERRATDPSTSSFPSGHTGASTAFAVIIGAEVPRWRGPLIATAIGVAYAQFYTGRHHLSDALVGGAMGAAAGRLIRILAQRNPQASADSR